MPGQTGKKSRKRRQAALERKATQHHEFVGEAAPERAEAEARKAKRLDEERNEDAVREMAAELEQAAGLRGGEAMREKARERLEELPEGAQAALHIVQATAGLLFLPLRLGFTIASELLRLPFTVVRVLRHEEA